MSIAQSSSERPPFHHTGAFWLLVFAVILVAIVAIRYYTDHVAKARRTPGLPVVTATAVSRDMPVYLSALGAVTPDFSVIVKTQITGQLLRVLFAEGQMVKKGDLLAEIDPRPYQALAMQYAGQLARDQALLDNARLDLKRYQVLWRQDAVAKQTLDTQVNLVKQLEGTVKLDQGLINTNNVNLTYCQIISPVNGKVGLRQIDPGNVAQISDPNGIVVINALNPITVVFPIPEDNLPQVLAQVNTGKILVATAYDRTQTKLLAVGKLFAIDSQIDPTTGTVKLKAQFTNVDNRLFPSQFVNIKLLVNTIKNATVVPTAAIQYGSPGAYVYLLNSNNKTVSVKPVVVGNALNNETTLTSGISPGQVVITAGADKLTDGATVAIADTNTTTASPAKTKGDSKRRHATA